MISVKYLLDKEGVYGYTRFGKPTIYINLEQLWSSTKDEESFIKHYADTVLHEYLHALIDVSISHWKYDYEERIVELMTNEEEPAPVRRLFLSFPLDDDFYENKKCQK